MKPIRIIIVEDKDQMSTYLKLALRAFGYEVVHITDDGEDAVRMTARLRPDLILMDIFLEGGLDGIEAARQIKDTMDIPVVFLSGHMDEETLERAKMCQPYGYLLKPFKKLELKATLEMAVFKHRAETAMKESHYWLDTTLKNINEAVMAVNQEGEIERMNSRAESLTGWSAEEALGRRAEEIFSLEDADGTPAADPVSLVLSENTTVECAEGALLVTKEGGREEIRYRARPHADKNGNLSGVLVVFQPSDDSEPIILTEQFADFDVGSSEADEKTAARLAELESRVEELTGVKEKLDQEILKTRVAEQSQARAREEAESKLGETEAELSRIRDSYETEKSENKSLKIEISDYRDLIEKVNRLDRVTEEDTYHESMRLLSEALSQASSDTEIARKTTGIIHGYIVNADYISLYMLESAQAVLKGASGKQVHDEDAERIPPDPENAVWKAVLGFKTVSGKHGESGIGSYLSVPLVSGGNAVGCILLDSVQPENTFSTEDIDFVEQVAGFAAAAIQKTLESRNLAEAGDLLREAINTIEDALIITGEDGTIEIINDTACEAASCSAEDAAGKQFDEIFDLRDKKTGLRFSLGDEQPAGNGHTRREGSRLVLSGDADGESYSASIVSSGTGRTVTILKSLARDILLEETALKANELETVCGMASGVAHDFNNMLTGILGHISLSKIYVQPGDQVHQWLADSEKSCLAAAGLARRFMFFADSEKETGHSFMNIAELIRYSVNLAVRGQRVTCDFSIDEDIMSAEINEKRLSLMLYNVALNSLEAMSEGGVIKVTARNGAVVDKESLGLESEGDYIVISVEGNGEGIEPGNEERLSEAAFTAMDDRNRLARAIKIADDHHGRIEKEANGETGTKVLIYLPAALDETTPETLNGRIAGGAGEDSGEARMKLMLMDDDGTIRDTTGKALANMGYDVEFASDGNEAVEQYKAALDEDEPFDAVILDLTVSGGKGAREVISDILEIDPDSRVILSSGYRDDPVIENFRDFGFREFIGKPYLASDLNEAIRRAVG